METKARKGEITHPWLYMNQQWERLDQDLGLPSPRLVFLQALEIWVQTSLVIAESIFYSVPE